MQADPRRRSESLPLVGPGPGPPGRSSIPNCRTIADMPGGSDIHGILIIASGPIVIGQGCELDDSGVQASKLFPAEGFRVVLLNSNPGTILTDAPS